MGDVNNLVLSWRSIKMVLICLPIVFCVILLLYKPFEQLASRILAAGLFACVFTIMPQIIGFAGFYDVWPELTFFPFKLTLWIGPLIYLHAFVLLRAEPLGWRKYLIIPGICQSIYYTWAFLFLGSYQDKWAFSKSFHSPYILPAETILSASLLLMALYLIWKNYTRYNHFVKQTESVAVEFEPLWLKRIMLILLLSGILFILLEGLWLFFDISYFEAFPFQVFIMLGIAWLSIEAVFRLNQNFPKMPASYSPLDAYGEAEPLHEPELSHAPQRQPEHSEDPDSTFQLAQRIKHSVIDNMWFLEPRFSLRQLTQLMGSNEAYISKAINQGLNHSFNDFINHLRVDYAKNLMLEGKLPLLNIALESGFNSKATFNRVFKGIVKQTPSQFKQQKGLKS